jgi:SAM-dependent methyltransferase
MLGLARLISSARRAHGLDWREGRAEALPVADRSVNVVWAISTFHHWDDPDAGIGEIHRVLAAGGILVLAERLVQPGAHGHAAHGLTTEQSEALASQLNAAGFTQVRWHNQHVGRRTIMVLKASQAGNPPGAR